VVPGEVFVAAMFAWVVLGCLIAGLVKLVVYEGVPVGWAPVMACGAIGAILGGSVHDYFWRNPDVPGFDPGALLMAVGGAVLFCYLFHAAIGRKRLMAITTTEEHRRAA